MWAAEWLARIVSREASPGIAALPPPEKPAKKCGSMKPVSRRRSQAMNSRCRRISRPREVRPTLTWEPSSRASFCTMRWRPAASAPRMARSSSGVLARWVPVALNSTMRLSGSAASASRTAGRISGYGVARVMSLKAIPTVSPGRTSSRSGGEPSGPASARRTASTGSGRPGVKRGSTTRIRAESGSSIGNPVFP